MRLPDSPIMTSPIVTIPQEKDLEGSIELLSGGRALSYVYARSRDTANAGAPGQDFIAFRYDATRIAFAVCDGVSQSFYGEIAARFLGCRLVESIWRGAGDQLPELLNAWTADADRLVQARRVTPTLPDMQRVAIERKRGQGSESMFIAGLVDQSADTLSLWYMGDMRVWLWDADGLEIPIPDAAFNTRERWSTRVGMKNGAVRTLNRTLAGIAHLTAHSDGVGSFAPRLNAVSQDFLNTIVAEQRKAPGSDDISILDIDLTGRAPFGAYAAIPTPALDAVTPGESRLGWARSAFATRYRIAVDDGIQPYSEEIDATVTDSTPMHFTYQPRVALGHNADCRVQAINDWVYSSGWSDPVTVSGVVASLTEPPLTVEDTKPGKKRRTEPNKAAKTGSHKAVPRQKKSRTRALLTILISCIFLVAVLSAAWIALVVIRWNELLAPR